MLPCLCRIRVMSSMHARGNKLLQLEERWHAPREDCPRCPGVRLCQIPAHREGLRIPAAGQWDGDYLIEAGRL